MPQRARQKPAGDRLGIALQRLRGAGSHHLTAAHAGARAQIDDVIGATDRVLVVLDHHQRIAGRGQLVERVEQHRVVARMQANGRLIEHVADALQVRAELRRQPDALCLAAGERRRRAVERQVAQAHALQETQAGCESRPAHRARWSPRVCRVADARRTSRKCLTGSAVSSCDRALAEAQMQRDRIEARAVTGSHAATASAPLAADPLRLLAGLFGLEALRRCNPVPKQLLHQPWLELNDSRRGSGSGKPRPHEGQARRVENDLGLVRPV